MCSSLDGTLVYKNVLFCRHVQVSKGCGSKMAAIDNKYMYRERPILTPLHGAFKMKIYFFNQIIIYG